MLAHGTQPKTERRFEHDVIRQENKYDRQIGCRIYVLEQRFTEQRNILEQRHVEFVETLHQRGVPGTFKQQFNQIQRASCRQEVDHDPADDLIRFKRDGRDRMNQGYQYA
ncbi:hypothetical protein D1872_309950 [compost metagenome]